MPKMKSNGGAKKRFKLTGTGKVKRSKSGKRHLLACKATGRKRKLRKLAVGSVSEENRVKRMLPYV